MWFVCEYPFGYVRPRPQCLASSRFFCSLGAAWFARFQCPAFQLQFHHAIPLIGQSLANLALLYACSLSRALIITFQCTHIPHMKSFVTAIYLSHRMSLSCRPPCPCAIHPRQLSPALPPPSAPPLCCTLAPPPPSLFPLAHQLLEAPCLFRPGPFIKRGNEHPNPRSVSFFDLF